MIDLAVVGQDPRFGGGVAAQGEAFLRAARELGRRPELLHLAYFRGDSGARAVRGVARGLDALNQLVAARAFAEDVRAARSAWVVSTVAPHGYAATRSGRPYACWIGTDLDSEWAARRPHLRAAQRAALAANAPLLRRLERTVLRSAHAVYATSAFSRERVGAAGGRDDVGILPIPIDAVDPLPDAEWTAALSAPTIVFVGRVADPRKNVRLLLEAFALLRERLPSARLRLVGGQPAGADRELVSDGVDTPGFVADRGAALRSASVFVLPSRQEGFGIVAAEALAAGVPVVSTPSGGPEELVRASGGGVVLSGFTAEELAATLADLLGDAARLAAMRAAGRAYVLREHSPERFRERLTVAFDELDR